MSRGLSKQQRAILGLGVRINRAINGGKVIPKDGEPVKLERWTIPVLLSPGLPEITARYVLHLIHGLPVVGMVPGYLIRAQKGGGFFAHTPQTRSLKASVTRAIRSLLDRDCLALTPCREQWPDAPPRDRAQPWTEHAKAVNAWLDGLTDEDRMAQTWGYSLRPNGIEAGVAHEPDLSLVDALAGIKSLQHHDRGIVAQIIGGRMEMLTRSIVEAA
jgi:hypothetical protein